MLVDPEHYKGISFVRISALPSEQRSKIRQSFSRELIVKILRDNSLINDCIVYSDYLHWYRSEKKGAAAETVPLQELQVVKV